MIAFDSPGPKTTHQSVASVFAAMQACELPWIQTMSQIVATCITLFVLKAYVLGLLPTFIFYNPYTWWQVLHRLFTLFITHPSYLTTIITAALAHPILANADNHQEQNAKGRKLAKSPSSCAMSCTTGMNTVLNTQSSGGLFPTLDRISQSVRSLGHTPRISSNCMGNVWSMVGNTSMDSNGNGKERIANASSTAAAAAVASSTAFAAVPVPVEASSQPLSWSVPPKSLGMLAASPRPSSPNPTMAAMDSQMSSAAGYQSSLCSSNEHATVEMPVAGGLLGTSGSLSISTVLSMSNNLAGISSVLSMSNNVITGRTPSFRRHPHMVDDPVAEPLSFKDMSATQHSLGQDSVGSKMPVTDPAVAAAARVVAATLDMPLEPMRSPTPESKAWPTPDVVLSPLNMQKHTRPADLQPPRSPNSLLCSLPSLQTHASERSVTLPNIAMGLSRVGVSWCDQPATESVAMLVSVPDAPRALALSDPSGVSGWAHVHMHDTPPPKAKEEQEKADIALQHKNSDLSSGDLFEPVSHQLSGQLSRSISRPLSKASSATSLFTASGPVHNEPDVLWISTSNQLRMQLPHTLCRRSSLSQLPDWLCANGEVSAESGPPSNRSSTVPTASGSALSRLGTAREPSDSIASGVVDRADAGAGSGLVRRTWWQRAVAVFMAMCGWLARADLVSSDGLSCIILILIRSRSAMQALGLAGQQHGEETGMYAPARPAALHSLAVFSHVASLLHVLVMTIMLMHSPTRFSINRKVLWMSQLLGVAMLQQLALHVMGLDSGTDQSVKYLTHSIISMVCMAAIWPLLDLDLALFKTTLMLRLFLTITMVCAGGYVRVVQDVQVVTGDVYISV